MKGFIIGGTFLGISVYAIYSVFQGGWQTLIGLVIFMGIAAVLDD